MYLCIIYIIHTIFVFEERRRHTSTNLIYNSFLLSANEVCHSNLLSIQQYNNSQYIRALQFLQDDERVAALGLCNFDTKRMEEVISVGVKVATNQVQVTLYQEFLLLDDGRPGTLILYNHRC